MKQLTRTVAVAALIAGLGAPVLPALAQAPTQSGTGPAPSQQPAPVVMSPAERQAMLTLIAQTIEDRYVHAGPAKAIAAEVRGWSADPALPGTTDPTVFADLISERLRKHDRHFRVMWRPPQAAGPGGPGGPSPQGGPGGPSGPSPQEQAAMETELKFINAGFEAVERLPGNVGYLRLAGFAPLEGPMFGPNPSASRRAAESALAFLGHTDAVIVDLRMNGGGDPAMVNFILSHFFGETPVLLNSFYEREGDRTVPNATQARIDNPRRPDTPLFVLVSNRSASGAEEFAYDVQSQKRGVIVGQTTAGAANPGGVVPLDKGFAMFISTGAPIDAVTKTNWEKVGVKPDVEASFKDALPRAHALALKAAIARGAADGGQEAKWELVRAEALASGAATPEAAKAGYVGRYEDITVALSGGDLTYQRGQNPASTLIPLGPDLFSPQLINSLHIRFQRDAAGVVTGLIQERPEGPPRMIGKT